MPVDKSEPGMSQCAFLQRRNLRDIYYNVPCVTKQFFKKHAYGFGGSFVHEHERFWDRDSLEFPTCVSELQGSSCLCLHCNRIKNIGSFFFSFFKNAGSGDWTQFFTLTWPATLLDEIVPKPDKHIFKIFIIYLHPKHCPLPVPPWVW